MGVPQRFDVTNSKNYTAETLMTYLGHNIESNRTTLTLCSHSTN